jgi:hypothetical protein
VFATSVIKAIKVSGRGQGTRTHERIDLRLVPDSPREQLEDVDKADVLDSFRSRRVLPGFGFGLVQRLRKVGNAKQHDALLVDGASAERSDGGMAEDALSGVP